MTGSRYVFEMRRIARSKELPKALYADFVERLGRIETEHWTIDPRRFPPFPRKEPEFLYAISLTRAVTPRTLCHVHFQVRPDPPQRMGDHQSDDDFFCMDFPGKPGLVSDFAANVAKRLLTAFKPYWAMMAVDDVPAEDHTKIVQGEVNKRYTVFRFHPFQYIGRTLCKRSFGLTPTEVAIRLAPEVENVEQFRGGVLYSVPEALNLRDCNDLDARLKRAVMRGSALKL